MFLISLDKQIHIYSVDTGAFYTNAEKRIHWKLCQLKQEKRKIVKHMNDQMFEDNLMKLIQNKDDYRTFLKIHRNKITFEEAEFSKKYSDIEIDEISKLASEFIKWDNIKQSKTKLANQIKKKLLSKLRQAVAYNEMHNKSSEKKHIRKLSSDSIVDRNVISVFDSALTRMLNIEQNELSDSIMVIKVYYFDIIKDLIQNGYEYNGERYKFFTASAGQIRTKKTVFIKERLWNQFEKTLMCGLTMDSINSQGGINVNKYLAYLALSNSATDVWEGFDIDKCIVVNDFETMVNGTVDFIDRNTFEITRKNMDIPIAHTDGCGIVLPCVSKKNFMARLPWIKGLEGVYDFIAHIKKLNEENPNVNHAIIKDIYGQVHNVIEEDIQVIFTKSQFKMHNYYKDWGEYKRSFKKYNCQAGYCNLEEDKIKNAKINYQMIQTLTDMTDDEIMEISRMSRKKLNELSSTVKSMLEAFGVTSYNQNKTYLQQALEIYPELLNDVYCKEVLKSIKKSMVKDYKSAKLNVTGKYTFILPDLYAFCEWLFGRIENPQGLLNDGEVYCNLYKKYDKLDCLRSPHLYIEHAVRNNVVDSKKSKWFITDAVYTSCHDLISKILQFDVDGDRSLVVADKTLVSIAERNTRNVVPLYYDMAKADPVALSGNSIYNGLHAAYTGGNIGAISNDITKIWNSGCVDDNAIKCVKWLTAINNFVIDYAKTLFKPTVPDEVNNLIKSFTKAKTPYFFQYAKDKERDKVEPKNDSIVNKLDDIIVNKRLSFSRKEFGIIDYRLMMRCPETEIDEQVVSEYIKQNRTYHFKINMKNSDQINIRYIAERIKENLRVFGYSDVEITDMLVKYLYGIKKSKSKESLWFCYGDIIVENLKNNIGNKTCVCKHCGVRFEPLSPVQSYCEEHIGYQKIAKKTIQCVDCGKKVSVDARNMTKTRCSECQCVREKSLKAERNRKYHLNKNKK